jgi:hypothetical protein
MYYTINMYYSWFQGVFEGFLDKPTISINLYSLDDWEARVIVYDWFLTN